jgi:hypothetical protein
MEVPLTEAQQRRFYFPAWNSCAVANKWFMTRGRLNADLAEQTIAYASWPEPGRELYSKVVCLAGELAGREHRATVPDDLRHACNIVAAGRQGSGSLDNKQTNRVVCLFRLLQDPEDLNAIMNWLNPDQADQKSYVAYLRKCGHEAAIISISVNAYGTRQWEDLPIEKLRWLCKQLKERTKSFHRPVSTNYLRRRRQVAAPNREPNPF